MDGRALEAFYAAPLGALARRLIVHRLHARRLDSASLRRESLRPESPPSQGAPSQGMTPQGMTPQGMTPQGMTPQGMTIVGIGFAAPFMPPFTPPFAVPSLARRSVDSGRRTTLFTLAAAGIARRPAAPAACLIDPLHPPVGDGEVDRLLAAHIAEFVADPAAFFAEAARILRPYGEIVVILPNRRGRWARHDHTPFGCGRPYSRPQAHGLLRRAGLTPRFDDGALYMSPRKTMSEREPSRRTAFARERAGRRFFPALAGVLIVEAVKLPSEPQPQRKKLRIQNRSSRRLLPAAALPAQRSAVERNAATPPAFVFSQALKAETPRS